MRILHLLVFLAANLAIISAEDETTKCEIENINFDLHEYLDYTNAFKVNDTESTIVEQLKSKGLKEVAFNETEYLEANLEGDVIKIKTTDKFAKDFDITETVDYITDKLIVTCKDGKKHAIKYKQRVEDINNHIPEFNEKEYFFEYEGPLPNFFKLTNFIEISATDLDCTDNYLEYKLEASNSEDDDLLSITTDKIEGKRNIAVVETRSTIFKSMDTTITISDRRGKNVKATLHLKISIPKDLVKFSEESYNGSVALEKNSEVKFSTEIALENGLDSSTNVEILKTNEYSEYFFAETDMVNNRIKIGLKKSLPIVPTYNSVSEIKITLQANWKNIEAQTELLITPETEVAWLCKVPGIDLQSNYYLSYDYIDDTFLGEVLIIESTLHVEDITCPDDDYLQCIFDKDANKFIIKTTDAFKNSYEEKESANVLKINFTVNCPYNNNHTIEFRQLIRDTNNHSPEFLEDNYSFIFYNEVPSGFALTNFQKISVKDVDISNSYCHGSLDENGEKYFDVDFGYFHEKICSSGLKLNRQSTLSAPFDETFTLTVDDMGNPSKNISTTLRIIVKSDGEMLKFTKEKYILTMNNNTLLTKNEVIELENGFDTKTHMEILESKHSKLFAINANILTGEISIALDTIEDSFKELKDTLESGPINLQIKASWGGLTTETKVEVMKYSEEDPLTEPPIELTTTEKTPTEETPTEETPTEETPTEETPTEESSTEETSTGNPPVPTDGEKTTEFIEVTTKSDQEKQVDEMRKALESFITVSKIGLGLSVSIVGVSLLGLLYILFMYF